MTLDKMFFKWVLITLLVGGCHCNYVSEENSAKADKRFLVNFGMHSGHSYDICRNLTCGTHTAVFDTRWQSCRCGNYALCLRKDTCHVAMAMAGCQYNDVDCERGYCTCKRQHAHQNTVIPTHRTRYSCQNIPCGAHSSSWDTFNHICRCGIYAFCDDVDRCKYILYSCPPEMRACENGICVCGRTNTHQHSTKPPNHSTSTLFLTTETQKPTSPWIEITKSTIPTTSEKTTAGPTTTTTQITTSTSLPTTSTSDSTATSTTDTTTTTTATTTTTSTPPPTLPTSTAASTTHTTTITASATTSTAKPTAPLTTKDTTTRTSPPVWITIPF